MLIINSILAGGPGSSENTPIPPVGCRYSLNATDSEIMSASYNPIAHFNADQGASHYIFSQLTDQTNYAAFATGFTQGTEQKFDILPEAVEAIRYNLSIPGLNYTQPEVPDTIISMIFGVFNFDTSDSICSILIEKGKDDQNTITIQGAGESIMYSGSIDNGDHIIHIYLRGIDNTVSVTVDGIILALTDNSYDAEKGTLHTIISESANVEVENAGLEFTVEHATAVEDMSLDDDTYLYNAVNKCHEDLPQVEPPSPGPYDRWIEAEDGLENYTTSYNSPTGIIIVRILARNNDSAAPNLSVTWDGVPLTKAAEIHDSQYGGLIAALFGIKGGYVGTSNLVITSENSCGYAAVRIGDLAALDDDWIGDIQSSIGDGNLIDLQFNPQAEGAGDLAQLVAFQDDRAYPITQYYDASVQWETVHTMYGPELIKNGDFSSDTDWTKGLNWTIDNGVATRVAPTGGTIIQQMLDEAVTQNARYLNEFEIVSTGGGGIQPYWRGPNYYLQAADLVRNVGVYSRILTPINNELVGFGYQGTNNPAPGISIDNVSLKEITGGLSVWFGRQETPSAGQLTYEANWQAPVNVYGVALIVELKGAVLPT